MPAAKAKFPSSVKGRYVNFDFPLADWSPLAWNVFFKQKHSAKVHNAFAASSPLNARACILANQLYVYPVQ